MIKMIEITKHTTTLDKYTIKDHPLYEWILLLDETEKYIQLWIKNISYTEMSYIEEYPNNEEYIPKIKEEIIKNHLEHIRQIEELETIEETIKDMYYEITRIRGKEVNK